MLITIPTSRISERVFDITPFCCDIVNRDTGMTATVTASDRHRYFCPRCRKYVPGTPNIAIDDEDDKRIWNVVKVPTITWRPSTAVGFGTYSLTHLVCQPDCSYSKTRQMSAHDSACRHTLVSKCCAGSLERWVLEGQVDRRRQYLVKTSGKILLATLKTWGLVCLVSFTMPWCGRKNCDDLYGVCRNGTVSCTETRGWSYREIRSVNLNSSGLLKFLADAYGVNERQSVAIAMGGHPVGSMDRLVRWTSCHYWL
jgi:hypothetical protein